MRMRIADRFEHLELGRLDDRDDLFAFHAGKSVEEVLDGLAPFKVINQVLERNACADENRSASQNLWVGMDDAFQAFSRHAAERNRCSYGRPSHFQVAQRSLGRAV